MILRPGTFLQDRYEILEQIGSGGMSVVYKAKCHKLNRLVAIKVLKEEFCNDSNFVSKFKMEAQSAAGLSHPNIVSVYDVIDEGKLHYIVMELIEGITLKSYIQKKGRLEIKETIGIAIQVAQGIAAAHEQHIIHRDIKPDNLMVSKEGQFKLGDFGIAREPISGTMTVAGTPDYMAPEVKETTIYDKTADIYSLGLVLYYLSNDFRLPFADVADPEERINRRMKKDAVLPEPENAFADMRKLILKACAYDPKDRYQSAGEMKKALENIQKHPYGLCPKCGKILVKKPGQYGAFVACTGYRKGNPDSCDYRMNLKKLMEQLNAGKEQNA